MHGDSEAHQSGRFLVESIAKALKRKTLSPPQQAFAEQIAADWRAEELAELDADSLAAALADAWRFGETFAGGAPMIRIAPMKAGGLDLLAIVQEDRPYLVDSVMGELGDQGLEVRAMFHPVAEVGGREVSMILVVLSRVGEDRRAALTEGLNAALADVRAAVEDVGAMTALMRQAAVELAGVPGR